MQTALKECLEAVACPTCGTKVILTKEKVLFCQTCLSGFPLAGAVPDLRLAHAINFKKMVVENKTGLTATFSIPNNKGQKENFEVKRGHLVVVGRAAHQDPESDITYFGINEAHPIQITHDTQKMIEKFLSQSCPNKGEGMELPFSSEHMLGGYRRDSDTFVDDKSVSRAHAIFYQDDENVWVMDLVSKNGTYVNGREVEKAKLKHGDTVSLGTVALKLKLR